MIAVGCFSSLGPRDTVAEWLQTLRYMAANRYQWHERCRILTESLLVMNAYDAL